MSTQATELRCKMFLTPHNTTPGNSSRHYALTQGARRRPPPLWLPTLSHQTLSHHTGLPTLLRSVTAKHQIIPTVVLHLTAHGRKSNPRCTRASTHVFQAQPRRLLFLQANSPPLLLGACTLRLQKLKSNLYLQDTLMLVPLISHLRWWWYRRNTS